MKLMLWLLALSGYTITAHCSLETIVANPGGIGGIFKGPDSETIVHGPDGSVITSQQKGGFVQTESKLEPIVVAEPQTLNVVSPLPPVVLGNVPNTPLEVVPQPALASIPATLASPIEPVLLGTVAPPVSTVPIGHTIDIVEPDPHIIETEIVDAPAIEPKESTDLIGPSGSISTRGSESIVSGPASTTISKPAKVLFAAPVIPSIPVITSLSAPIHPTPLVEVNNELPLSSPGPLISTGSPLDLGPLQVSTTASPLSISSTIAPPLLKQSVSLFPTNGLKVLPIDGLGIGSTLAPATLNNVPSEDTYQRGLTIDNSELVRHGLGLANPHILRFKPESPVLLTGEQYDDAARPNLDLAPPLLRQRIPLSGLLSGEEFNAPRPVFSSTASPPVVSTTLQTTSGVPNGVITSEVKVEDEGASGYVLPQELSSGIGQVSSTQAPWAYNLLPSRGNDQNLQQQWYRQLTLNPSQIPQQNIVPPEIGLPKGAIDLGSTVHTQTTTVPRPDLNAIPRAPGLISSSNIQRVDKNNYIQRIDNNEIPQEVERTFQNGYYQNEILIGNTGNGAYSQSALLSNTNPVTSDLRIPADGTLQSELGRNFGDSSPGQYTNTPYANVGFIQSGSEPDRVQDYNDGGSASLWNRYGRRRRRNKKQ